MSRASRFAIRAGVAAAGTAVVLLVVCGWDRLSSGAHGDRGIAWGRVGNYDEAIAEFTRAIEIGPDDAWTYHARGLSFAAKGELDQAIRDYTKAIELRAEYAAAQVPEDSRRVDLDFVAELLKQLHTPQARGGRDAV